MKTYPISEEFIKAAHESACPTWKAKIEKEVPELFKSKVDLNKWYWWGEDKCYLMFFTKKQDHKIFYYGFNDNKWDEDWIHQENTFTPATDEEVQSALIDELAKQGIKEGVHVKSLYSYYEGVLLTVDSAFYNSEDNQLWWKAENTFNILVFEEGKFASIFSKPKTKYTIAELEAKLGDSIEIVSR